MKEYLIHSYYSFIFNDSNTEHMVMCTLENKGIVTTVNKIKSEIHTPQRIVNFHESLIEREKEGIIRNLEVGMPMRIIFENSMYKLITDEKGKDIKKD